MQKAGQWGIRKTLWAIMTAVFVSVLFLSLFQVSSGMSMPGEESHCPFMSHEEVLCSMSTLDHLVAWKSTFIAAVPTLTTLLLLVATVILLFALAPNRLLQQRWQPQSLSREVRNKIYTFSYRPLQELFSNGILHPKLF